MSDARTFYKLQQPYSDEEYLIYGQPNWEKRFGRASWTDEVVSETIQCPVYPGHQRAGRRIGNLVITLPSEGVGDFVWTWYSDCLITDKVLQLFQRADFAGFTVNPVVVKPKTEKGKKMTIVPVLWELIVTGQGGNAHPDSGIRLIYTCPHCGLAKYSSFRNGIIIDELAWDGSDFFTVTGYQFILITERVKSLIIRHNLANCALIPCPDLVWKAGIVKPEDIYHSTDKNNIVD
jgi:hypothetical protein